MEDKVKVKFYDMEVMSGDRHSFAIDALYSVNFDVKRGQNGIANFIAFVANHVWEFGSVETIILSHKSIKAL